MKQLKKSEKQDLLIQLIDISPYLDKEVKKLNSGRTLISYQAKGNLEDYINSAKVHSIINKLFRNENSINTNISFNKFMIDLNELLPNLKKEDGVSIVKKYNGLLRYHKTLIKRKFDYLFAIYGTKLRRSSISFGDFTLFNIEGSGCDLVNEYPTISGHFHEIKSHFRSAVLVKISVEAVDEFFAIQKAETYIRTFEYVLYFYLSIGHQKINGGIYDGIVNREVPILQIHNDKVYDRNQSINLSSIVKIDELVLVIESSKKNRLWKLITKPSEQRTEMEERLMIAIHWYGKAISDIDVMQSYLMYFFAIESLLSFHKDKIIDRLTINLCKICKFHEKKKQGNFHVIGDDISGKRIKDLYDIRSRLTHGPRSGKKYILPVYKDLSDIEYIAHSIIDVFSFHHELSLVKTTKELDEWLDRSET